MPKKIYIGENRLSSLIGENTEEGQFTIGMEKGAPVGGEYYHVDEDDAAPIKESVSVNGDVSRIDYIEYIPHDNPMEEDIDMPYYEVEAFDVDGERVLYGEFQFDELYDYFDETTIHLITNRGGRKVSQVAYRIDNIATSDMTPNDINDVDEVNALAKRIQTNYGPSKFILTDGDVIGFADHSNICTIDGMTIAKFVSLGNIRVGMEGSIEVSKMPNSQQIPVLKSIIRQNDGDIYLDITEDVGAFYSQTVCSARYRGVRADRVINDLYFYFKDGVRPQSVVYESRRRKKAIMVSESQVKLLMGQDRSEMSQKLFISESQESKSIAAAKKLVMQRLNYDEQEADEFVRIKLRNDLPVLRTPQGGKFILGVTRMFCDSELRTANDIGRLNSTLKLIASDAHINEYDRNLNNLSCQELIQRFAKAMSDNLEAEKDEINQMVFDTPSDYEIVRIDSFEQAQEYGSYVSWCVTHDNRMFDSYTSDGINQFYFCLKNGFENVAAQPSNGCPLDEYGLSMIAVSVDENGRLNTCTCRWNHDNDGNDSIMNTKEVSQVIGMNFFDVFKPNSKWKEILADVMQRLANGESPDDVFDGVGYFSEGFAVVCLNEKYNHINQEGRILSDKWYDWVGSFREGFAEVELNGKSNFINHYGDYLTDQWFDDAGSFREGFADIDINGKMNFINQEGDYLTDQWFDDANPFKEGFARVQRNGKFNFINKEGNYLTDKWYDFADNFCEGFASVNLNGKYNFINQEGDYLTDQWFQDAYDFDDGFAKVKLNGKMYKIDTNGKLHEGKNKNSNKPLITEAKEVPQEVIDLAIKYRPDEFKKWAVADAKRVHMRPEFYEKKAAAIWAYKLRKQWDLDPVIINLDKLNPMNENVEIEVDSSEVDLSSFEKQKNLPSIWKDEDTLESKVRLKLLDIADDFWEFVNVTWVEPKGIIITGSLCNFNWSEFSDVDLHIIADFSEIDERTDFVKSYLDSKKNEWNDKHDKLKVYGFPVELYVQDVDDDLAAGGIYDLEENKWIKKPSYDDMDEVDIESDTIKDSAANIMTIIDDMVDYFLKTDDLHKLESLGNDADYLWDKIKELRTKSLSEEGEMSDGNIIYKYIRRKKYIDKLFDLRDAIYDKLNTVNESKKVYISENKLHLLKESKPKLISPEEAEAGGFAVNPDDMRYLDGEFVEPKNIGTAYKVFYLGKDGNLYPPVIANTDAKPTEVGEWLLATSPNIVGYTLKDHRPKVMSGGKGTRGRSLGALAFRPGWHMGEIPYAEQFMLKTTYKGRKIWPKELVWAECEYSNDVDYQDEAMSYGYSKKGKFKHSYAGLPKIPKNGSYKYRTNPNPNTVPWIISGAMRVKKILSFDEVEKILDENGIEAPIPMSQKEVKELKKRAKILKNKNVQEYIKTLKNTINEETVLDGSANGNPYEKRWKAEREALKNFICNFGTVMQSKEDNKEGKLYKVYLDRNLSNLIGYNYCLCVQWDETTLKPKSTVYVRAYDKFTTNIKRNVQFDDRGRDNDRGTVDDVGNSWQPVKTTQNPI